MYTQKLFAMSKLTLLTFLLVVLVSVLLQLASGKPKEKLTQEQICALHKKCREHWKELGKDTLPKYDIDNPPEVGEYFCLHTEPCIVERKKFCTAHKEDGHETVEEYCTEWAEAGWVLEE